MWISNAFSGSMGVNSQSLDQTLGDSSDALINTIFQKISDLLLLIWYVIEHGIYCLMTSSSEKGSAFEEKVLCLTTNYAQFSDLPQYVALQRTPYRVNATFLEMASRLGFTLQSESIRPKPSGGHCFGNVCDFLKKWKENPDIEQVVEAFRDGSTLEGAIYQEVYNTLFKSDYCYPRLENTEEFCYESAKKQALLEAGLSNAGLSVEKIYWMDSKPGDVLRTLSNLDFGLYQLSMPTYNCFGQREASHAIGLIIDAERSYILDSNNGIGWTTHEGVQQTIGRIFTQYVGYDYSEDLDGKPPSGWKKICNAVKDQANPPDILLPRFELVKVTLW